MTSQTVASSGYPVQRSCNIPEKQKGFADGERFADENQSLNSMREAQYVSVSSPFKLPQCLIRATVGN